MVPRPAVPRAVGGNRGDPRAAPRLHHRPGGRDGHRGDARRRPARRRVRERDRRAVRRGRPARAERPQRHRDRRRGRQADPHGWCSRRGSRGGDAARGLRHEHHLRGGHRQLPRPAGEAPRPRHRGRVRRAGAEVGEPAAHRRALQRLRQERHDPPAADRHAGARHRGGALLRRGPQLPQQPRPGPAARGARGVPGRRGRQRRAWCARCARCSASPTASLLVPEHHAAMGAIGAVFHARGLDAATVAGLRRPRPARGVPREGRRHGRPPRAPAAAGLRAAERRRCAAGGRTTARSLPRRRRRIAQHQRGARRPAEPRGGPALPADRGPAARGHPARPVGDPRGGGRPGRGDGRGHAPARAAT